MEASDLAARPASSKSPSARVPIGRAPILALAIVLAGSTAYAAFASQDGEVTHSVSTENPRTRLTQVGFASWHGIIPAPDCPEYAYQEIQLPSGDWVKHGHYGRRTREGFAAEDGFYNEGRREGRWSFWGLHGELDVERSGFYSEGVRVKPGPVSPTDLSWALSANGS
jgi:hypothetical protein